MSERHPAQDDHAQHHPHPTQDDHAQHHPTQDDCDCDRDYDHAPRPSVTLPVADRVRPIPSDLDNTPPDPDTSVTLPPGVADRVRLIASDLDNTLLGPDMSVTPRTRAAIAAAAAAGVLVVAATGRQLATLPLSLAATDIDYVLASNGSHACRISTGETLFTQTFDAQTQAAVAAHLAARVPGVLFGAARDAGDTFVSEPGYTDLMDPAELATDRRTHVTAPRADVVSRPAIKLIARHPSVPPDELLAVLAASGLPGFHATTSGAPFLEVAAPGVTKATGLARLCALLGVAREEVLACGDARNDVELLAWAGCGVAVANAVPEALAAADVIAPACAEDGFAQVVEAVLSGRTPAER